MTFVDDNATLGGGEPGGAVQTLPTGADELQLERSDSAGEIDPQLVGPVDIAALAPRVIVEHKTYWLKLAILVGLWTVLVFYIMGIVWLMNLLKTDSPLPRIQVDISAQSAFGAMAILATVIVALQIAVRSVVRDTDADAAKLLARQRALETIAIFCGFAAAAVGVSATVRAAQHVLEGGLVHAIAPLAGGLLLAALSADAATASSSRLNSHIATLKQQAAALKIESSLKAVQPPTAAQAVLARVFTLPFITLLALANVLVLLFPLRWGDGAGVPFVAMVATCGLALPTAWGYVSLRLNQRWGLLLALKLVLGVVLLAIAFLLAALWGEALTSAAEDELATFAAGITTAVAFPILLVALISLPTGWLTRQAQRLMEMRLHYLRGERNTTTPGNKRSRWVRVVPFTALILPLVGIPVAQHILRRPTDPDMVRRLQLALCFGYSSLAVYTGWVAGLLVHISGAS